MNKCTWTEDFEFESWSTSCGHEFCVIDGTPKENNMKYCPYCGDEIEEKLYQEEIERNE